MLTQAWSEEGSGARVYHPPVGPHGDPARQGRMGGGVSMSRKEGEQSGSWGGMPASDMPTSHKPTLHMPSKGLSTA